MDIKMDELNDDHNQFKLQSIGSDIGPFVIELEGRGAVCLRGDSIYNLTKYDGNNVQVAGLVSQDGISFFPISSDLTQTDDLCVEHPLFINVPVENHGSEFILDEEAVAIPINDVNNKDLHEINNYEITDINSDINQLSEFDNKVSILELVDTPELKEKTLPQPVIQKHSTGDVVRKISPTFVIDSIDNTSNVTKEPCNDDTNPEVIKVIQSKVELNKDEKKTEGKTSNELVRKNKITVLPGVNKRGRPKKEKDVEPPVRKGPFICETCHTKVSTWSQYKTHRLIHVKEKKTYTCKVCSKSFNIERNLNLHLLLHNVGNLTCTECNKSFTRFASFKAHLLIHQEEENVFCSECGDEFNNNSELEEHLRNHRREWREFPLDEVDPKNILTCKTCSRMFTNPLTFEFHQKDHQRLKTQLMALAPKKKRKRFRNMTGGNHVNECTICRKTFPKPSQLIRHLRIHTGEKPFKCSMCNAAFSQKGSLQIHMSKHNGYKPHVCSCCSLSFTQRGNLISHVNKVHRIPKEGEETYKCVKCPCSFKKLASLNCHVTRFHISVKKNANTNTETPSNEKEVENKQTETGESEVDLLNRVVELEDNFPEGNSDSDILQTAIRISGLPLNVKSGNENSSNVKENPKDNETTPVEEKPKPADVRVVTIADKGDDGNIKHFTVQQRREGNIRWHQCNMCLKEFKKPSDLIRHFRIHTREKPFKCNQCSRTFSIKSTLKCHIRTHSAPKFQECNTCGKKVTTIKSLKIHQRTHYGIKPFYCNICMRAFTTSGQFKTHLTTNAHKAKAEASNNELQTVNNNYFFEEPFLIVGDGEFRQQLSRKEKLISRSQNASSAERPYECEYCQLKFRKSSHLKQHKLQHTGEKPFSCFVCHKNFTTNGVLKMHLRTHLGQKDFSCDRCTSKFSTKGSLKRHTQTFHSEDRRYMCPYCQKRFKTSVNCRKHIKIHRYDNSQQFYKLKLNGVQSDESKVLTEENVTIVAAEETKPEKPETSESETQTLLADSTGTITLSALNQETLTQESIRELEQTLNQQLFDPEQGSEYTVQMISTVEGEKENDFIEPVLLSKPLILNMDETMREPSIVQAVFSQTEELQTVSNMSEILPDTKDPNRDYVDINDSNDKENEVRSFCPKEGAHFTCEVCSKVFSSSEALRIHSSTHTDKKEFNCELCGWSTLTRASFKRHCSIHNETKKFTCPQCPAKFRLEIHLRKHQKLHETSTEELPNRVGKRSKGPFREFSDAETELLAAQDVRNGASVSEKLLIQSAAEKVRLDEKKTIEEPPEREPRGNYGNDCKYCEKSFKKPSDLIRHVRVHTGERPYQCAQCNKCFRVKSTLSSHLRTHYGVKPVSCHICQSMFAAKSSLKVHMRLHTGAKPFECPICGQRFRTSGHKKNHILSHAKNKPKPWKKQQQLQMLNKIAVALVVNLSDENELEKGVEDNIDSIKPVENELQPVFEDNEMNTIQNGTEDEAVLLQLNDQNNIVQLLSTEESQNEIVPAPQSSPPEQLQFQIYTTDGQVYITHPNPEFIICGNEATDSNDKKADLEDNTLDPLSESVADGDITKNSNICQYCLKIFSKKSLLERHLRVHTGERPYACDFCGKRFTQSNALNAHLRAHKGDRAFTCPYCDFSCVQRGNLRIHISRTHQFAYFLNEEKTNNKLKNSKSNSSLFSDSLLKTPQKSPTGVRPSDIDEVMGELFPQVT